MTWTRGPTIGRGSTAAVSLAITPAGDFFAVKSADISSSTLLQREKSFISQLCSPYIVRCLGSDTTCEGNTVFYNLFLEYLSGGTLSDQIKKQGNSMDEGAIRVYAHQVLMGLNYLHRKGLVHCDVKGQNILVGEDGLKIADFGCAKWVESGGVAATWAFSGTPAYMAPEVASGEEQSFPADVWAFGCTVIEMATGSHPWPEMKDPASTLYRIAFSGDVPECPSWFSDEAKDFLSKCLVRDSKGRWTTAQLLRHPFFRSVEDNCGDQIRGVIERSPTSVTDQGFWDALELKVESSRNPTEIASTSDSPTSRIGALIGDASPASLNFGDEEEWLTVRGNEIEESTEESIEAECEIVEQGIETLVLMENYLWDCFNGDISAIPLTLHLSVKHFLYLQFSFLIITLIQLFHQHKFFLQLYNLFFIISSLVFF